MERQMGRCDSKASLIYIVSFRMAKAIQTLVLTNKHKSHTDNQGMFCIVSHVLGDGA